MTADVTATDQVRCFLTIGVIIDRAAKSDDLFALGTKRDEDPADRLIARFSIIVHYLTLACKPQFVAGNPLKVGWIAPQSMDILDQFCVILFELCDFCGESTILRFHPVVFYQPHLPEDERREKVENKEGACREQNFISTGTPGDLVGLDVVPFTHVPIVSSRGIHPGTSGEEA